MRVKKNISSGRTLFLFLSILVSITCPVLTGCTAEQKSRQNDYGVYLSAAYNDLEEELQYETLVIDAQYYTEDEIDRLHENNNRIYSYVNIGAIEEFREYYDDFEKLFLGDYENWPEEKFIDVSEESWQQFILHTIALDLAEKGVDGFFLDNFDVYDEYRTEEIFHGLTLILQGLKDTGLDVVINGGDVYVSEYLDRNRQISNLIDAVNQEGVFTSIHWNTGTFQKQTDEDTRYFLSYLDRVREAGCEVYIIEYTENAAFAEKIRQNCNSLGYTVYVSQTLELE